jgi:acetyltransferase-like isoleucine patch superfamily enzyme
VKQSKIRNEAYWKKRSIKETIYLIWQILLGIPKTVFFNVHYLGVKGFKMPVLCSYKVKLVKPFGKVIINASYKFGMIKLGFTAPETYDNSKLSFIWVNDGVIEFKGNAGIRNGVSIRNYGKLVLGEEFHISSPSTIICYKGISFGRDVLIGWNCEFSDGDAHKIYSLETQQCTTINTDKEIVIGNHVWFGANSKIYKGVHIGNNVIVAGGSIIVKSIRGDNQIIGGYPTRILKSGVNWRV